MHDMIKLFKSTNRKGQTNSNIVSKLAIYSTYKVEVESISPGEERQVYFVPNDEHDFYTQWRQDIVKQLICSGQNAALIENIMRYHGL